LCPGFGDLTTVTLYTAEPDGRVGEPVVVLKRIGAPPKGRYVEISLSDPPPEWRADLAPPDVDSSRSYELRAWNGDGGNRISSFPFRISELRDRPEPTKLVLTKTFVDVSSDIDRYHMAFLTPEEFRQAAEDKCSDR
jgi:hypothetical protein